MSTWDGSLRSLDLTVGIDLNTTHTKVYYGCYYGNVEFVVHDQRQVVEVLLAERIVIVLGIVIVLLKGFLDFSRRYSDFFGKLCSTVDLLHQSSAHVMLAMPFNFLASSSIQHQSVWCLVGLTNSSD